MNIPPLNQSDSATVLAKAFIQAADRLGITKEHYSQIIGHGHSSITRRGIDPTSKSCELTVVFLRCYLSLSLMVTDNEDQMRHWLNTHNQHLSGIPAELIESEEGLITVCQYLEAMRGK